MFTFGELLRGFRNRDEEISQQELAYRLGVSRLTVSNWERSQYLPNTQDMILKIAEELRLSQRETGQLLHAANYPLENNKLATEEYSLGSSVAKRVGPPMQKPQRVPYFTGRVEEIKRILNDLQLGRVVTISGPGGIGKTALAAEVIWRLAPGTEPPKEFPDGIFAHSFYNQPQVDLAFEHIVESFGAQRGQGSARDATNRALQGRRALLVLDGVENADDLEKLLNVCGDCGVLMTTRHRHDDPEEYLHSIPTLPAEEAKTVLQAWSKGRATNDTQADEICELIGCLPLALRLAGSYMVKNELMASEYLEDLRKTPLAVLHLKERQHQSVEILLEKSVNQLKKTDELAVQTLAVVGLLALAPFDREIVAAALEIAPVEARRSLSRLVDYSLLERPEKRYQVTHALVHTYAKRKIKAQDWMLIHLAVYYKDLVEEHSQLGAKGYTRLDSEHAHLMAVFANCFEQEEWIAVNRLARAIDEYLDMRDYRGDRLLVNHLSLIAAQILNDRVIEGVALSYLGDAYTALGQHERAFKYYELSLFIAWEIGNRHGQSATLSGLGATHQGLGQYPKAIKYYKQALTIAREISDRKVERTTLSNLGNAYLMLGQYEKATEHCEQALTIDREIGNHRGKAATLINLGIAYHMLGRYEKATEHYEQALTIDRETSNHREEATALINLGSTYMALGQHQKAIEHYEQALAICRKIGNREYEDFILARLRQVYDELGRKEDLLS
jgi:tetratricopeptide (TPR) repeat protein